MDKELNLKHRLLSKKTLFSFLLAFVILYLMFTRINVSQLFTVLKRTNVTMYLAAFVVYYAAFPVRALRFSIMLANNGCRATVRDLSEIIFVSWFANCVVPAKLGDVYRAYLVRNNYRLPFSKTLGSVFVERVFDLFVLYLMIGVTGLISFQSRIPPVIMAVFETSFAFLGILGAVLLGMKYAGHKIMVFLPNKVREWYGRFLDGTRASFRQNWQLTILTAIIWFLEGLSFYLVTLAIGMNLNFYLVIFIGLISALLTALPVTPAGLGLVEMVKVSVLMFFGVDRSVAVSAALLDRLVNYWSILLAGLPVYLTSAKVKRIREEAPVEGSDSHSYI